MLNKKVTLWKIVTPLLLLLVAVAFMADSCGNSQTNASQQNEQNAANKWGAAPNITNYYEYLQLKQIYEERDNPQLILNAYLYSEVTGQLTCFGKVKGFGIPYGTQFSQPDSSTSSSGGSVPEPNGLFPSNNTNADWVQLIDPKTGKVTITFVEPNLIITPQVLPCKPLSS